MSWEQETIINFCEGEDEADVYTHSDKWMNRFEKVLKIQPYQVYPDGARSYKIAKKRLTMPRAKLEMSDERRKAAGDRLSKMRSARKLSNATKA